MNMQQECRQGYVISPKMKKVWSVQMDLLKKLLEVCEKHNLKIWADSGTLLGAVREKGYIPWDDDIDMIMLRKDYKRLVEISKQEFTAPYFFQSLYTEKHYPRGHAQLRMQGTTAILPSDIDECFDQSIFIDIFVLDRVPETEIERTRFVRKLEFYRRVMHRFHDIRFPLSHPKKLLKSLLLLFPYLLMRAVNFNVYRKFDNYCSLYADMDGDRLYYCGLKTNGIEKTYLSARWYGDTVYMQFEDIQIPVPTAYTEVLKSEYGSDYMKPSKRPSLHGSVIFDTERPYTEVLEDIRKGKISLR